MQITAHAQALQRQSQVEQLVQKAIEACEELTQDHPHFSNALAALHIALDKLKDTSSDHLKQPIVKAEGKVLRAMDIRPRLNLTGLTSWRASHPFDDDDRDERLAGFKEAYGVDVNPAQYKVFAYTRSYTNRSELNYLEFHCVPGYFMMEWNTDRASGGTEWYKNEELESTLKRFA